jgi:hypothetical protein
VILLWLVLGIALSFSAVQTKIANYFVERINQDFGINLGVDEVSITAFGGVKLKKVLILDHHNDTLIYANRIKTNILGVKKVLNGDLLFGKIALDGLLFNLKTYKKENKSNLDVFIAAFETGKPSKKDFLMTAQKAIITQGHFILIDENRVVAKTIDCTQLNVSMSDFKIFGPAVKMNIDKLSFYDYRGLFVERLSSQFSYSKKQIRLEKLDLVTPESKLKAEVVLNYDIEDFKDFNNKVIFDIQLASSLIGTNDIRYFYKGLAKNKTLNIKSNIQGTLNNLNLKKLILSQLLLKLREAQKILMYFLLRIYT